MKKRDQARIIIYMLALCLMFIVAVGINAYSAKVQYDLNMLNRQITETQTDIRTLEVRIKSASNITNVEGRARELGFVYPEFDQLRYLAANEKPMHDFALALMEAAYD